MEVLARTAAGKEVAGRGQTGERFLVEGGPLRLNVGTLVPIQPEPDEILHRSLGHARDDTRPVQILQTPDEGARLRAHREPRSQRRAGVADMDQSRGRGGIPPP